MRNILIANVGSTSYKYALYGVSSSGAASELARGGIGGVSDFSSAITDSLASLSSSGFDTEGISAVAFKTVLGKDLSGLREADESVLEALDAMADVAPAHNPPYAAAIRAFGKILPRARLVALFETSFYQWADPAWRRYAVPASWDAAGIRRNGFHGATHKYAAERVAEMCGRQDAAESARMLYVRGAPMNLDKAFRPVNCHLGGSSSVCGILNGAAVGSSMGFTPQSGLPQNNRVGDLDAMAVPFAMKTFGIGAEEAARQLHGEGKAFGEQAAQLFGARVPRDIAQLAAQGLLRQPGRQNKNRREGIASHLRQYSLGHANFPLSVPCRTAPISAVSHR